MGSDSRETFSKNEYVDNRQKTFINKELKLCWSMTGMISYNNVDLYDIINHIMNMPIIITEKLLIIENLMCFETERFHHLTDDDIIFDMFIGQNENKNNALYVLEVKNGISQKDKNKCYRESGKFSSGIKTKYQESINSFHFTDKITGVKDLDSIIHLIMKESNQNDKTVGGDTYIVVMDNKGNINTYINAIECDFEK